jgi:hypothetical protein
MMDKKPLLILLVVFASIFLLYGNGVLATSGTFGDTTHTPTSTVGGGYLIGSKFLYSGGDGLLATSITCYLISSGGTIDINYTFGIYFINGTLAGHTGFGTCSLNTTGGYFTLSLVSPVTLTNNTQYYLCVDQNRTSSGSTPKDILALNSFTVYQENYTFGSMPSTFAPTYYNNTDYVTTIYANYRPAITVSSQSCRIFAGVNITEIASVAVGIISGALNYIANVTITIISGALHYIATAVLNIVAEGTTIISSIYTSIIVAIQTNNPPNGLPISTNFIIFLLILIIPTMISWSYFGSIAVAPMLILMTIISYMANLVPFVFVILVGIVAIGILFRKQMPVINRGSG